MFGPPRWVSAVCASTLACFFLVLGAPLWIVLAVRQRLLMQRYGLRVLWPVMATTSESLAELWAESCNADDVAIARVGGAMDAVVAQAPDRSSLRLALIFLELLPLLVLRPRFSSLDLARRGVFLKAHHWMVPHFGALRAAVVASMVAVRGTDDSGMVLAEHVPRSPRRAGRGRTRRGAS